VPEDRLDRCLRATFLGLAVNLVLTAAKFAAGAFGHSQALIADACESLADLFSSMIVWRGLVLAAQPADEDHPYGHGKAEPIAAAVVSVMLLLAAAWIIFKALHEIDQPRPVPAPYTLLVLVAVVAVKEYLFRLVLRESASVESSVVKTDAWHHRCDAITSLCAACGISVALIGGPRFSFADNLAAVAAAGMIAFNGWRLLRPALNELMDTAPDREMVARIRHLAETTSETQAVETCRVRKMGYQYYVDLHVEVDPAMTVKRSHEIAHQVKNRICTEIPAVRDVLVHIEPARQSIKSPD
jgi:cation diffusion facilitator family transporter